LPSEVRSRYYRARSASSNLRKNSPHEILLEAVVIGIRRIGKDQADNARILAAMRRLQCSGLAAARLLTCSPMPQQRSDPELHRRTSPALRGEGDPSQRGGAGPAVDLADPVDDAAPESRILASRFREQSRRKRGSGTSVQMHQRESTNKQLEPVLLQSCCHTRSVTLDRIVS
jgi:hypothetical protein